MRVRDLPIAGRLTEVVWRKRRYRCAECGRTFTETHEQLPTRQRVTVRFGARLAERVVDGAAHAEVAREERTSRYQVARAFADRADELEARDGDRSPRRLSLDEADHRCGHGLATVVCDLDRRVRDRGARRPRSAHRRAVAECSAQRGSGGPRGGLDRLLRRLPLRDPGGAAARADRLGSLPPGQGRQRRAGRGAPRTPAPGQGRACGAAASTPPGAQSSTAHATAYSRRGSG